MCSEVVLLTGAGGYLGRQLVNYLTQRSVELRALVRAKQSDGRVAPIAGINRLLDWPTAKSDPATLRKLLSGVTTVVHLASSQSSDPAQQTDAHLHMPDALLAAGAATGLRRFISLSSVKAIAGEHNPQLLAVDHVPCPNSAYGEYKLAAEELVRQHSANAQLATYVLRLPMVYGANSAGNFGLLRKMARAGLPLPVGKDNRRSVLYADNLFSVIRQLSCADDPSGSTTLHVADEQALSTYEFFKLIAAAEGVTGRTLPLSVNWAERLEGVPGVGGFATRLLGSLVMDTTSSHRYTGGQLPFDTATAVRHAVQSD